MFGEIEFDERGLAPCVVQDFATGEVLMLAYVSAESLEMTLETGDLHFHSRSRDELWRKAKPRGTSCTCASCATTATATPLVAMVDPAGPPATPASAACFYREVGGLGGDPRRTRRRAEGEPSRRHEALPALERTLRSRAAERPEGSYTVKLLDDPTLIGEKVEEEAEEVVRAAPRRVDERVAEEAADLLYHLSVLLVSRGVSQADVMEVLNGRRQLSPS